MRPRFFTSFRMTARALLAVLSQKEGDNVLSPTHPPVRFRVRETPIRWFDNPSLCSRTGLTTGYAQGRLPRPPAVPIRRDCRGARGLVSSEPFKGGGQDASRLMQSWYKASVLTGRPRTGKEIVRARSRCSGPRQFSSLLRRLPLRAVPLGVRRRSMLELPLEKPDGNA